MASARKPTPAQLVERGTKQILQAGIDVLWHESDEDCTGLGPIVTLERHLGVSQHFAKRIVESLEHLGHLGWTGKRGMGSLYYVDPKAPKITLSEAKDVLKHFKTPPARHLKVA